MSEFKKEAQSRKLRNVLAPVRFLGKKFLGMRSKVYSEALTTIEKADDIIRDAAFKQKVYLKDMKSLKKKLQGVRFAQVVAAFLREQELILQITNKIQSEFEKITGKPNITDINPFINNNLGVNPEYYSDQTVEEEIDIKDEWEKERPGYINRLLKYVVKPTAKRMTDEPFGLSSVRKKKSKEEQDLIKNAFLEGWYWRKTKSGKEYAKAFENVYNTLNKLFEDNVKLLEKLDEQRSIGDPQEYFSAAKNPTTGFFALTNKRLDDEKFKTSWTRFDSLLIEQDKYDQEQKEKNIQQSVEEKFDKPADSTPDVSISDLSSKKEDKKEDKKIEMLDFDFKKESPMDIPDLELEKETEKAVSPEEFQKAIKLLKEPSIKEETPVEPEVSSEEPTSETASPFGGISFEESFDEQEKAPFEPEVIYEPPKKKEYVVRPIKKIKELPAHTPELPEYVEPGQLPEHAVPAQLPAKEEPPILPEYKRYIGKLPEHEQEYLAMLPQQGGEKYVPLPPPEKTDKPSPLMRKNKPVKDDKAFAHTNFINELTKLATEKSEEELALFILSYADEIDGKDNEYALKLTAIAEGILNA